MEKLNLGMTLTNKKINFVVKREEKLWLSCMSATLNVAQNID